MTYYRHGQWVGHDGEPLELTDYAPEVGQQEQYGPDAGSDAGPDAGPGDVREAEPERTRSAEEDPRESQGAQ